MYAGLLSISQVCFYVLRINHCQIFCATYSLVLMSISNSLFGCSWVFTSILFFKFSTAFPHTALFINFYNTFQSFSPFFSFYSFLCVCVLSSLYDFNHYDSLNSNTHFNRSFIMKHILFLSKKLLTNFLPLVIGML